MKKNVKEFIKNISSNDILIFLATLLIVGGLIELGTTIYQTSGLIVKNPPELNNFENSYSPPDTNKTEEDSLNVDSITKSMLKSDSVAKAEGFNEAGQ